MPENLLPAAELVLRPSDRIRPPDSCRSERSVFGSVFISFLLKCHMLKNSSRLCWRALRPILLHLTALDTLWAIYDTRSQAVESLASAD